MTDKKEFTLTPEQQELADKLTHLNKMTAIYYASGVMSQREAYRAAGGKAKKNSTADTAASQILAKPEVEAFYNSLVQTVISENIMSREEALESLTRVARAKITDFVRFSKVQVGETTDGEPIHQTTWEFKNSDDVPDEVAGLIQEVSATKMGIRLKLYSSLEAKAQLSKMQGWEAPTKVVHDGLVGNINMSIDPSTDPLKASETYMEVMRGIAKDQ